MPAVALPSLREAAEVSTRPWPTGPSGEQSQAQARLTGTAPAAAEGPGARGGLGVAYGLLKAALDGFAAGAAPELREKHIAIIDTYPGFTLTDRLARVMAGADTSWMERPETTTRAVGFLFRDPMPYTGQTILTAREAVDENNL